MTILIRRSILVALATVAALAACDESQTPSPEPLGLEATRWALEPATSQGLAELRHATAAYHDVAVAMEDGFEQILPCIERPDGPGGLGIPYGKLDRFDANVDLSEPEILFYEPQKNGSLRLVGAEPVIPIALWTESTPPSLFGREFHRNEEHGLYGLHMWVWRHNPDGMFAFWHPDVSCEFAD